LNITNIDGWYFILLKKGYDLPQYVGQYLRHWSYLPSTSGSERFALNIRETSYLNTNMYKCSTNQDIVGDVSCVWKYVEKELNCTLPWLRIHDNATNKCKSKAQYKKLGKLTDKIINSGYTKVRKFSGCLLPCKQTRITQESILKGDGDTGSTKTKESQHT
jgi:hypothetical protein